MLRAQRQAHLLTWMIMAPALALLILVVVLGGALDAADTPIPTTATPPSQPDSGPR